MSLVQSEATSEKEDLLMNRSRVRARVLKLAQCQVFAVIILCDVNYRFRFDINK